MQRPTSQFAALEIGRNVPRANKSPAAELCAGWNASLAAKQLDVVIHPGFGATGNYLITCTAPITVDKLADILDGLSRSRFVVFASHDFAEWVGQLEIWFQTRASPAVSASRRPTPGAIMNRDISTGTPSPLPRPVPGRDPVNDEAAWTPSDFARPRVRGVWKNDLLRADGKALDRSQREGTWGALARAMKRVDGGDWTARALR
jgi:hypothetical protein